MKAFRQHLHEIFDSTPIPLRMIKTPLYNRQGGVVWKGNWLVNGKPHSFEAYGRPIRLGEDDPQKSEEENIGGWVFGFTVDSFSSASPQQEVEMKSETAKIFATALEALRQLIKEYNPKTIRFTAEKEKKKNDSRVRLYDSMVKRFAGQQGYKLMDRSEDQFVQLYVLVKK
jgi:hypothetical protein